MSDVNVEFTQPVITATFTQANGLIIKFNAVMGGGVTSHHALTDLATYDDHPQYLNQARGDARYSLLNHSHTNLTAQTALVSIYANSDTGNDANDGSSANPVQTWARVLELVEALPYFQSAPLVIVLDGVARFSYSPLPQRGALVPSARTWIVGANEVVVDSGTLTGGSSYFSLPLGVHTAFAHSVRFADGHRRTILRTGATSSDVTLFYPSVATGTAFDVVKPKTGINIDDTGVLAAHQGMSLSTAPVIFLNLEITRATQYTTGYVESSFVHLLGCTFSNYQTTYVSNGSVACGAVDDITWFNDLAGLVNLTLPTDYYHWRGWGIGEIDALDGYWNYALTTDVGGAIYGTLAIEMVNAGTGLLELEGLGVLDGFGIGGSCYAYTRVLRCTALTQNANVDANALFVVDIADTNPASSTIPITLTSEGQLYCSVQDSLANLATTLGSVSVTDSACLTVSGQGNTAFKIQAIGTGSALTVNSNGKASLRGGTKDTVTGGSAGYGVDARGGGRVAFTNAPSQVTGGAGALIVQTGSPQPNSALSTSFASLDYGPGSIFRTT